MESACQGQVTAHTWVHLTYVEYMCVVLGHLVLSVLAALGIYVLVICMCYGFGVHLVSACCTWHMCWLYVCVVGSERTWCCLYSRHQKSFRTVLYFYRT